MSPRALSNQGIAVLPSAPNDSERVTYIKRRVWWLLPVVVCAFGGITYGFVRACLITVWFDPFLAYWAFVIVSFVIAVPTNYFARDFDLEEHDALVGQGLTRYPSVDIWLPNCGESIEILRNTWNHVAELSYPGEITVYVLDDVGLSTVEELASEFGFVYFSRPDKGWMKKSGNLRHAYQRSSGEIVALFDADFCPRPDFLLELVPYLDANPKTAIVQSSQYFRRDRRQHWIERGAAEVQEFFYRVCQVSRSTKRAAICCGTNAIYRRTALDENGGMTLVPQGEDMRTGFDLTCKGWLVQYLPLNLAMGLNPSDMSSYFKQQYRWCTGSLRLVSDRQFWDQSPALTTTMCYLAGFNYYIQTAAYNFILPPFVLSLLVFFPNHFNVRDYEVIIPAIAIMVIAYPLWHRCRYGPAAWSIRVVQQWTYVFAILDFIRDATIPWDATGSTVNSVTATRRYHHFRTAVLSWNGLLTVAWACGAVWRASTRDWVSFLFVTVFGFFWLSISWRVIINLFLWQEPLPQTEQA
jgi:cellulose synthase/poly-beta-1,6-N-acetylglucosamine synthase-like glycosyltransferase